MTLFETEGGPKVVVGPKTLDEFLTMSETIRVNMIMEAEDEIEVVKDMEKNEEWADPKITSMYNNLDETIKISGEVLREIELARAGLEKGDKQIAIGLLKKEIAWIESSVRRVLLKGDLTTAEMLMNNRELLVMLLEDQVE